MSDLRKAAQAVIQAWDDPAGTTGVCCALDALRAALAELTDWEAVAADQALTLALLRSEPKQEPVAWMVYTLDGKSVCVTDNPADFSDQHKALPLYATPPQRQPLTDEEIAFARHINRYLNGPCRYPDCVDNSPDGKCTRWLMAECEKSEDFRGER